MNAANILGGAVIGAPPFPRSIDDLDVDVLEGALGSQLGSFEATRIGADRGMLGEIYLLELDHDRGGEIPSRIVAKFAFPREGALASGRRSRAHERELRCYDELLATTPVTAPALYGGWYDPDTGHFLLLQEAMEVDPDVDQVDGVTVDQARLVLREAARLHARWLDDPALTSLDWLPRLDSEQRRTNLTTIAADGWEPLSHMIEPDLGAAVREVGPGLTARVDAMLSSAASHRSTLIHSDLRADNLLFSRDGSTVALVDWQGSGVGPPGFDVGYFLSGSLAVGDRRAHEDELLEHYRSELATAGVEMTPDEVRAGYDESLLFGLLVACAIPLISDPDEARAVPLAGAMAERALAALDDHRLLGAWT